MAYPTAHSTSFTRQNPHLPTYSLELAFLFPRYTWTWPVAPIAQQFWEYSMPGNASSDRDGSVMNKRNPSSSKSTSELEEMRQLFKSNRESLRSVARLRTLLAFALVTHAAGSLKIALCCGGRLASTSKVFESKQNTTSNRVFKMQCDLTFLFGRRHFRHQ